MPMFRATRRVAVTPETAYSVASDVSSYKDFLPLTKRSHVRGEKRLEDGVECFDAELIIAYDKLNLREGFVSKVRCNPVHRSVEAQSKDGPFKVMKTSWTIAEAPGGSEVTITIDYSLKSVLLQVALSGLMDMAVSRVMTAFEGRAKSIQALA